MFRVSKPLLSLPEMGGSMYKIREAAKLLNVETIDIHKKLISLKKELANHVHKKNGITTIDQEGIDIISLSFAGIKTEKITAPNLLEKNDKEDIETKRFEEKTAQEGEEHKDIVTETFIGTKNEQVTFDESDLNSIKADINYKKNQLNSLNQKIVSELERTANYTRELNDLHDRIRNHLR